MVMKHKGLFASEDQRRVRKFRCITAAADSFVSDAVAAEQAESSRRSGRSRLLQSSVDMHLNNIT